MFAQWISVLELFYIFYPEGYPSSRVNYASMSDIVASLWPVMTSAYSIQVGYWHDGYMIQP
jgi:hypothetical protein